MLDYKDIIIKSYALNMSGAEIARQLGCSKSGVNDFLNVFKKCETLSFHLPEGITNCGIAELVYGKAPASGNRDESFELPDYSVVHSQLITRKNMTLIYQWNRYKKKCEADALKHYSYRQFCERYSMWCDKNEKTAHFTPIIAQTMEVDFAGKTFEMTDRLTGEVSVVVVFVAVLPYSQMIYAEGMISTKEPLWIQVNNNALAFYGGVPALVVCDNCKQAVITNEDWIQPELNKDYAEWAEHNHTAIVPAKVRKPKYKSSVENSVGILEKGFFHDLEERQYFSLEQFNSDLWEKLDEINYENFKHKEHSRCYYWEEEKAELMPLPSVPYEYMERKEAKVSSDFHVRFDNAYYSVDKAYKHQKVSIKASTAVVKIYSQKGVLTQQNTILVGKWITGAQFCGDEDAFFLRTGNFKKYPEQFSKLIQVALPDTWRVIGFSEGHTIRNVCLGVLILNVVIWVIVLLVHMLKWQKQSSLEWCFLLTTVESSERYYFMGISFVAFAVILNIEYLFKKRNDGRLYGSGR